MRAGTGEYHYLKGMAAMHAHAAVILAWEGAQVAPAALEGPAGFYRIWGNIPFEELDQVDVASELLQRTAEDWVAPELSFKRYPVNYFNQPFIDAARTLQQLHDVKPDEILNIHIRVGAHPAKVGALGAPPFKHRSQAMMSTRFGIACMLARGRVQLGDTLQPEGEDIRRLAELVDAEVDPRTDGAVHLELATERGVFGGDMLPEFSDYRLSPEEVRAIAAKIVVDYLGDSAADRLMDLLHNLERSTPAELLEATRPNRRD
jgi:2-methylcitrate dehydratase PrpD